MRKGPRVFDAIRPTDAERHADLPGDELIPHADVVMDRAFTLDAPPETVWPWLVQVGKGRAGWYLPRRVERVLPPGNRAIRRIDPQWQGLAVGDIVPDYGRDETLVVASIDPGASVVFTSQRKTVGMTWTITLATAPANGTRVALRLRLGPVRRVWLANSVGELFDAATIAGMAAGLRERLA